MTHPFRLLLLVATTLATTACATGPYYTEEPHHFSKDNRGNRVACYATDVANEYDCVPVHRRHPYAYDPFYDPFWPRWSIGFYYGWPHHWYSPYPFHHHHPHWRSGRHRH